MLVEDEPLVAWDLEDIVVSLGHEVVGVATCLSEAVSLVEEAAPIAALIDVRLRDGFTGPLVAEHLASHRRVRCAFVTGNPEQVEGLGLPIVAKPFSPSTIETVLKLLTVT